MLFEVRDRDATRSPFIAGTFIDASGRSFYLKGSEIEMQPLEWWHSARTGARYPIRWRLAVRSRGIALECSAAIPDQELAVPNAYWEGAVRYSRSPTGVGYMELTGYAEPVRLSER